MTAAAEVGAALAALCPPGVGSASMALDGDLPPLWAGEEAAVTAAVSRRRREFAGGRAAARVALRRAGFAPATLPALPDRCPRWPEGVRGSIAHSASIAIAAVGPASAWQGIGVDLEGEGEVGDDLAELILRPEERGAAVLGAIFCAKEAVQKALFPTCGALLEFHDLSVQVQGGTFAVALQRPIGPLSVGSRLEGRLARAGGHILAAVFWPSMAARNNAPSLSASMPMS